MKINGLETPALIVDADVFDSNIQKMNELLSGKSIKLRPHYKSHKCAHIAHRQIENGAIGLTCAKLSEAIDLVDSGIEDVLIANQIVEESKIMRLADLAKNARITVCVDNEENIKAINKAAALAGSTVHCLIEKPRGVVLNTPN